MEISPAFQEHPDDDIWEEYTFGRLSYAEEASLEEHLLVCEPCQTILARLDDYILAMKFETARLAADPPPKRWKVLQFDRAIAGTVAAAGIAVLVWMGPVGLLRSGPAVPVGTPVPLVLESFRSGRETGLNRAPAKRPLELSIPLADVPASPQYRLEIVTFQGETIWSGAVNPKEGTLSAHIAKSLGSGTYWIRLYAQSSELLAEYGLKLD